MKLKELGFITLLLLTNISCSITDVTQKTNTLSNTTLKVETAPKLYSPVMSSTVGIQIKPIYKEEKELKLTMKTDKGFFLSWNNNGDSKVYNLGKEVIYDGKRVFWSYDMSEKFNQAEIKLTLQRNTKETLKELVVNIKIDEKSLTSVVEKENVTALDKIELVAEERPLQPKENTTTQAGSDTKIAFKGYELYTWKEDNKQVFALLLGTNRNKMADEIKNAKVSFESILEQISKFAKGETVTLVFAGMHQSLFPAELSAEMKQKLKELCEQKGINLNIG